MKLLCTALLAGLLVVQPASTALAQEAHAALSLTDLTAAAEAGDPNAQFALAERHHTGSGVLQNHAIAADWYRRAADQGLAAAQNQLGRYYHSGLGVATDQAQALRWLGAAADQGAPAHLFDLGAALENGADGSSAPEAAAEAYRAAADQGHIEAMTSLGVLYQDGIGVAQNFDQARSFYEAAAAAGDARAQNNLGLMFARGTGVTQDYERAAALFQAAVDQGLGTAMTNLGVMYENGFGVPQSDQIAAELYRRGGQGQTQSTPGLIFDARLIPPAADTASLSALVASAQAGDPVAAFLMGWIRAQPNGETPADMMEAALWFRAAAIRGHGPAMANLGWLYHQGLGVPQDFELAQTWLILAQATGLDTAAQMAALQARMTPAQVNAAQARAAAYQSEAD